MKIAIGLDSLGWHNKFMEAINQEKIKNPSLEISLVNLDANDWIEDIKNVDLIIWKPFFMSTQGSTYFKEKIYFIEHFLGKRIIPNYQSTWHFESKIAQSYIFKTKEIFTPKTISSFDFTDAKNNMDLADFPLVFKASEGAGSKNVWMADNKGIAQEYIEKIFFQQLWDLNKTRYPDIFFRLLKSIFTPWFLQKIYSKLIGKVGYHMRFGAIYWQDFIPGNSMDLRITVIGDCYAVGFWRHNRKGDFRASGSGMIDYERHIPEEVIRYCLEINQELGFDSMAYDVLFTNDGFVINEMSFAYVDTAIFNAPGYYEKVKNVLIFHPGHTWPQELWVKWALQRL